MTGLPPHLRERFFGARGARSVVTLVSTMEEMGFTAREIGRATREVSRRSRTDDDFWALSQELLYLELLRAGKL